jgi:hypothetical protein
MNLSKKRKKKGKKKKEAAEPIGIFTLRTNEA